MRQGRQRQMQASPRAGDREEQVAVWGADPRVSSAAAAMTTPDRGPKAGLLHGRGEELKRKGESLSQDPSRPRLAEGIENVDTKRRKGQEKEEELKKNERVPGRQMCADISKGSDFLALRSICITMMVPPTRGCNLRDRPTTGWAQSRLTRLTYAARVLAPALSLSLSLRTPPPVFRARWGRCRSCT